MIFRKQETQIASLVENGRLHHSPLALVRRRFRTNRLAVWALRLVYGLLFLAVLGDFIANEKPIYCKIDGVRHFPVIKQYAVNLGLSRWDTRLLRTEWKDQPYQSVVFPPIPYSAKTIDPKNNHYRSPFGEQTIRSMHARHWLGTDQLGHDVAAGMIEGARVAMLVGLLAMSIATFIGLLMGSLAGYFGDSGLHIGPVRLALNLLALFGAWFYGLSARGFAISEAAAQGGLATALLKSLAIAALFFGIANGVAFLWEKFGVGKKPGSSPSAGKIRVPLDLVVMRAIEVMNSIPGLLLLLALVAVMQKSSIFYVMAVIGLIRWTGVARYTRAELLKIRNLGYVEAARAMGFPHRRILWRHAVPVAIGPVLITIAFGVASSVLLESTLSFLGIGVGDEGVTWGKLLSEARGYPAAWWLAVFPGGAIFLTVTAMNLIGEGLTEAISKQ